MFFSRKLQSFENIKHCFFSRKNGFSDGSFESLNCGLGSDDKKENVLKNLESVSVKIGCDKESLITLNQKHSNEVICFNSDADVKNKLTGDAIVSKVKNVGIGVVLWRPPPESSATTIWVSQRGRQPLYTPP